MDSEIAACYRCGRDLTVAPFTADLSKASGRKSLLSRVRSREGEAVLRGASAGADRLERSEAGPMSDRLPSLPGRKALRLGAVRLVRPSRRPSRPLARRAGR